MSIYLDGAFSYNNLNDGKSETISQEDSKTTQVALGVVGRQRSLSTSSSSENVQEAIGEGFRRSRSFSDSSRTESVRKLDTSDAPQSLRSQFREKMLQQKRNVQEKIEHVSFNKSEWEPAVFTALQNFTKQMLAKGIQDPKKIVKLFIEKEFLQTLPIQTNIQSALNEAPNNNFLQFFTTKNAKGFLKTYDAVTKERKKKVKNVIGGNEVIESLRECEEVKTVALYEKFVARFIRVENKKLFLDEGFDKERPIANIGEVVGTFRWNFASDYEPEHLLTINGQRFSPPDLRHLPDVEKRQKAFMTWLMTELNNVCHTDSELSIEQQVDLVFAQQQEDEKLKEAWLNNCKKQIPCFAILQAFSVNARQKAYQALEHNYPSFYPSVEENYNFDKLQLKELATDQTKYDVTVEEDKNFTVTHIKPLHFIVGRTSEYKDHGQLTMRWHLSGNLSTNQKMTGLIELKNLELKGSIPNRSDILDRFNPAKKK